MKYFQTHIQRETEISHVSISKIMYLTKTELWDGSKIYILGAMVICGGSCQL